MGKELKPGMRVRITKPTPGVGGWYNDPPMETLDPDVCAEGGISKDPSMVCWTRGPVCSMDTDGLDGMVVTLTELSDDGLGWLSDGRGVSRSDWWLSPDWLTPVD